MIEPLLKSIEPLVVEELARANEQFPQFHSSHEGQAIIEEEVEEAAECMDAVYCLMEQLKQDVFHDRLDEAAENIGLLRRHAKYAAAELIQVAAMCDKYEFMEVDNGHRVSD